MPTDDDALLARCRKRHVETNALAGPTQTMCPRCLAPWPCDTAQLCALVERLTRERDIAIDQVTDAAMMEREEARAQLAAVEQLVAMVPEMRSMSDEERAAYREIKRRLFKPLAPRSGGSE